MNINITIEPTAKVPCLICIAGKNAERQIRLAAMEEALWGLERIINEERLVHDDEQVTLAEWKRRHEKEGSCAA